VSAARTSNKLTCPEMHSMLSQFIRDVRSEFERATRNLSGERRRDAGAAYSEYIKTSIHEAANRNELPPKHKRAMHNKVSNALDENTLTLSHIAQRYLEALEITYNIQMETNTEYLKLMSLYARLDQSNPEHLAVVKKIWAALRFPVWWGYSWATISYRRDTGFVYDPEWEVDQEFDQEFDQKFDQEFDQKFDQT